MKISLSSRTPPKNKENYYTFFLKKEQEKKTLHCTKAQKLKIDGNVNEYDYLNDLMILVPRRAAIKAKSIAIAV